MHLSRRKSLLSCARKNSSNADDWANHDGDAIFAAVPSTIAQARRDGGPGRFFPGRVRATNSRGIGRRSRCVSSSRLPRSPRGARGGSKSRTQHECHALSHNAHADAGGNRTIVHVTPRQAGSRLSHRRAPPRAGLLFICLSVDDAIRDDTRSAVVEFPSPLSCCTTPSSANRWQRSATTTAKVWVSAAKQTQAARHQGCCRVSHGDGVGRDCVARHSYPRPVTCATEARTMPA
jgi:hypothetical protein